MNFRRRLAIAALIGLAIALAEHALPAPPPPALDANGNAATAVEKTP